MFGCQTIFCSLLRGELFQRLETSCCEVIPTFIDAQNSLSAGICFSLQRILNQRSGDIGFVLTLAGGFIAEHLSKRCIQCNR